MIRWKHAVLLALFFSATAIAHAQDVVQLKNGKRLSGTVIVDEHTSAEGFRFRSLETGGTIFVKWSQVPSREKQRLLAKPAMATEELVDGIRIVTTSNRFVLGVLVDATGAAMEIIPATVSGLSDTVYVKTRESNRPVPVPRSAVDSYEPIRIRESDAYSPAEMVARRETMVDPNDATALLALGDYARGQKLYPKARELWQAVVLLDPSRQGEVDARVAQLDKLVAEEGARTALDSILKLARKGKFEEALSAIDSFLEEYGETETAIANPDLAERIEKEKEAYEKNRTAYLAVKVPQAWRSLRTSLLKEYAKKKYKCAEARNKVSSLDQEIQEKLSTEFNCPPEDLLEAWEKRDSRKRSVGMSDGSWLHQPGGNGGEIDYQGGGGATGKTEEEGAVDDFVRRFGGKQKGNEKKQEQQDPGKKLKTADEWWSSASSIRRRNFLEAEYALTSAHVKVIKKVEKKCSRCRGEGTRKEKRNGESVQVLCSRCHGGAVDFTVTFD